MTTGKVEVRVRLEDGDKMLQCWLWWWLGRVGRRLDGVLEIISVEIVASTITPYSSIGSEKNFSSDKHCCHSTLHSLSLRVHMYVRWVHACLYIFGCASLVDQGMRTTLWDREPESKPISNVTCDTRFHVYMQTCVVFRCISVTPLPINTHAYICSHYVYQVAFTSAA